jgi:hypothetical protein
MEESVRNNFIAVAQKFSLPGLATQSTDLEPVHNLTANL